MNAHQEEVAEVRGVADPRGDHTSAVGAEAVDYPIDRVRIPSFH